MKKMLEIGLIITTLFFSISSSATSMSDPLASWNEGPAKNAILDFVRMTTLKGSPQFVPQEQRIATFDQDGTLWVEQPIYTQVIFALDRIAALAPQHPEWKNQQPYAAIIAHDKAAIAKFTTKDLEKIVMVTHTGMTPEVFEEIVHDWMLKAKNPRWHQSYNKLIYQPMLELMQLLRDHGYQTYIASGGGQDFIRVYSNETYHVPREQVIGSTLKTHYTYDKQGKGILIRTASLLLNDDLSGKPEDLYLFLGRHPQAAFGNSVGDQQMLEYTEAGKGAHLLMLVHHDDEIREYAYGANAKIGTFSDALMAEAKSHGWVVISMKNDWKRIFSFEAQHD